VGERRIGVARSDPTGLLATPVTTVLRPSDREAVAAIAQLAAESGATLLVVGLPLGAEGEVTDQARRIQAFGRKLRAVPGTRVVFWDERFTTETAHDALVGGRAPRRGQPTARQREADRRRLDAAAAAVILQDYLDHRRDRRDQPGEPGAGSRGFRGASDQRTPDHRQGPD
jgi:putative holliday junction resolvase